MIINIKILNIIRKKIMENYNNNKDLNKNLQNIQEI